MSLAVTAELSTPAGTYDVNLTVPTNSSDHLQVTQYELTASPTTIPVPSWALGVLIEPNTAATNALLYAEHTGDTVRNISPTAPSIIAYDAANLPSNIYLQSSGSDSYYTTVTFF